MLKLNAPLGVSASINTPFWEKHNNILRGLARDCTSKFSNNVCILICIWNDSLFLMQDTMKSVEVYDTLGKISNCWNKVLQIKMSLNLATLKISRFLSFFFLHSFRMGKEKSRSWNPPRMIELRGFQLSLTSFVHLCLSSTFCWLNLWARPRCFSISTARSG